MKGVPRGALFMFMEPEFKGLCFPKATDDRREIFLRKIQRFRKPDVYLDEHRL